MDFIQTSNKQLDKFGAGKHGFSAGNPGLGVLATYLSNIWCDSVQQELMNVIEAAGLGANPASMAQLLQAIKLNSAHVGIDTGAANAAAVVYAPVVPALVDGMVLWFKAAAANTGAATLNVNGIGAKAIVGGAHSALQGGEIVAGGKCMVVWNAALDSFVLIECTGAALQVAPGTKPAHAAQVSQVAGVVGSVRNLRATQTVASASLVITADEVVVQSALGGSRFCIPNFNKTLNVGAAGAGGMDTGAAPASGWVACYAVANPSTGAYQVIGVNATASIAPEIYGGANMPAGGYTHSALIGVWPTTAGALLAVARQIDRTVHYYNNPYSGSGAGALTLLSIAGAVPRNAITWRGNLAMAPTTTGNISMAVCPTSGGQGTPGYVAAQCYSLAGATVGGTVPDTPIFTPQTTYFVTAAAGSFVVNSYGYTF